MIKALRAALASAAIAIAAPAFGLDYWAEYGQCSFKGEDDGIFRQTGRNHSLYMTPDCLGLGVSGRFVWPRIADRWRVGFFTTRYLEARDNIASIWDEDAWIPENQLQCTDAARGARGCLGNYTGSAAIHGLTVELSKQYPWRSFTFEPGLGLLAFYNRTKITVMHANCPDCQRLHDTYRAGERKDIYTKPPEGFVSLAVRHKSGVYAAWRRYFNSGHRDRSFTNNGFDQIVMGYEYRQ